ncbi:hypothetical protein QJS10_CPA06g01068 [Acorus calamus]|uniref:Reverse transcriptase domain-containing protein n=1 Tax=Acorus calamus TaxID=4465 RepID=A0AAV9ENP0_ACOCL|nr:hypothetical protein QJS10_CPA06g01068 [Acorus calamus]
MAKRLREVYSVIIEEEQSAFLPGRTLQEGFVVTQELVAAIHNEKQCEVALKPDFAKAYDSVNWEIIKEALVFHVFSSRWIAMICHCITMASASVIVNGGTYGHFHINGGPRQGDPISPILFTIVANILGRMMRVAVEDGWIKGLGGWGLEDPISHAQFAILQGGRGVDSRMPIHDEVL